MKLSLFFLPILSFWAISTVAQNSSIQVYQYFGGGVDFVEVYFRVAAEDLTWQEKDGLLEVETNALLLIREIGGDTIFAQKYQLAANEFESKSDLLDMKRIILNQGGYEAILQLGHDKNTYINSFLLKSKEGIVEQSSLLLAADRTTCQPDNQCRIGLQHEPLPNQTSNEEHHQLYFYNELYINETLPESQLYIRYGILDESGQTLMQRYKKYEQEKVIPIATTMDVSKLTSGTYVGFIEVYSIEKKLLSTMSSPFIKVNLTADLAQLKLDEKEKFEWLDTLTMSELKFDLKSIWPLLPFTQAATYDKVIKSEDAVIQKRYLQQYWKKNGGEDPYIAYSNFRDVAVAVHERFYNTVGYGFETDRGYIFMKYGKPNDIIAVEDEPEAPPYQIWRYNYITRTQQSNVKFLFYNPSLVANDFELLHSTCRGEFQNPAWEVELYKRAPWDQEGSTIEATTVKDGYNRQAKRLFEDL